MKKLLKDREFGATLLITIWFAVAVLGLILIK